jgi:nitroreductase
MLLSVALSSSSQCTSRLYTSAQSFHVWAVRSPERLADIRECTRFHFDAPCVLIYGYRPEGAWTRKYDGKNIGEIDVTIAATHGLLEITELGLGSCWVGYFDPAEVKKRFPETEGYEISALFPMGYPADDAEPSERHTVRKSEEELLTKL